jgi:hypothetical protein
MEGANNMSMDNVQLKQEDMLNNDVVLSDINPVTNTASVDDSATGEKLQTTIELIWNAINNKLTRVVNSVNGRTGVVILTSEDVGLGNVDNVSFTDIKQWLIERLEQAFRDKKLYLFNTMDEVNAIVDLNDESYAWAPFFVEARDGRLGDDQKSCIGLFTWDTTSSQLSKEYMEINTIGFGVSQDVGGSPSIIYDQQVDKNGTIIDMRGGGIAVNIHKDEDALYIDDSGMTKSSQGLRIDKSKVTPRTFFVDGVYGYNETYKWATVVEGYFNPIDSLFYKEYDKKKAQYSNVYENGNPNFIYRDKRKHTDDYPDFEPNKYYASEQDVIINEPFTTEPFDWRENYMDYYEIGTDPSSPTYNQIYHVPPVGEVYAYGYKYNENTNPPRWSFYRQISYDSLYGEWKGEQMADSFLTWNEPGPNDPLCEIIVDGRVFPEAHINRDWINAHDEFRKNDIIICVFSYDKYVNEQAIFGGIAGWVAEHPLNNFIPYGMNWEYMSLQPAVGTVTQIPVNDDPTIHYRIEFKSLRTNVDGYGVKYIPNHQSVYDDPTNVNSFKEATSQLGIDVTTSQTNGETSFSGYGSRNVSGVQTVSGVFSPLNGVHSDTVDNPSHTNSHTFSLLGADRVRDARGGLFVSTDGSIANFAEECYSPNKGRDGCEAFPTYYDPFAEKIVNQPGYIGHDKYLGSTSVHNFSWSSIAVPGGNFRYPNIAEYGYGTRFQNMWSRLTVNLNKIVGHSQLNAAIPDDEGGPTDTDINQNHSRIRFYNAAGLKFIPVNSDDPTGTTKDHLITSAELKSFGMNDGLDAYGNDRMIFIRKESGGLSVNVGRFLEINPVVTYSAEEYNDGGKVNVRIGKGLKEDVYYKAVKFDTYEYPNAYDVSEKEWEDDYDNFAYRDTWDPLDPEKIVDLTTDWVSFTRADQKPNDWDTEWWKYWFNPYPSESSMLTDPYRASWFRIPKNNPPEFVAGTYYEKVHDASLDIDVYNPLTKQPYDWETRCDNYYVSDSPGVYTPVKPVAPKFLPDEASHPYLTSPHFAKRDRLFELNFFNSMHDRYKLYRKVHSNRIVTNIDEKTLQFTEDGKVRVSDDVGGKNIRITDARGCYFDTAPSKATIDDFVQLGTGLKVIGGTCPKEYFSNKASLKNYILDTLGDNSGANLTIADCIGVYIQMRLRTTDPDPSYYTADLNNVGPRGVGAIYSPLSMTPSSSLELSYVNTCYHDMMEGFDLGKNAMMAVYPKRQYLQVTGSALKDRISDILDTATYKTNYFELFTAVKSHYSLGISFDESDSASMIRAKFTAYFSNPIILKYFSDDEFPLDWLFNEYVAMLAAAPESGDTPSPTPTPTPTSYELVHPAAPTFATGTYYLYDDQTQTYSLRDPDEEPSDWATSYVNYYTRSGSSEPYTYTQVTGEPSDWQSDFGTYYTQDTVDTSVYNPVEGVAPRFEQNKYYERTVHTREGVFYNPLTTEPEDWSVNFRSYYMLQSSSQSSYDQFIKVRGVAPTFEDNKYYRAIYTG